MKASCLALLCLTSGSCALPFLHEYTAEVVQPVGARTSGPHGSVVGVELLVKNIEGLADGLYVLELPGPLLAQYRQATPADGTGTWQPASLQLRWVEERLGGEGFRERVEAGRLLDLAFDDGTDDTFDLRVDTVESADKQVRVEVRVGRYRDRTWQLLGAAELGRSTQHTGLRQSAWLLAPVALVVDLVFVLLSLSPGIG